MMDASMIWIVVGVGLLFLTFSIKNEPTPLSDFDRKAVTVASILVAPFVLFVVVSVLLYFWLLGHGIDVLQFAH